MAINIVEIQGTDSIASSRITINNNFTEIRDKVDPVLDTYDTSNGVINISELPNGQVIAKRLVITTAGINVQGGAVSIGSSSNVVLNGGNLSLTTGTASIGGNLSTNKIIIGNGNIIEETGNADFTGSSIGMNSIRKTYYIGDNNPNTSILLQALSNTTEIMLVNDKTGANPISLTFTQGSGLFGNSADTSSVTIQPQGTAIMKFIVPDGATDGKWWYFGGSDSAIAVA